MPTLKLLGSRSAPGAESSSPLFTPVELQRYFNATPTDLGPRFSSTSEPRRRSGGKQQLRGIPFLLGPPGADQKSRLVLTTRPHGWATRRVEIPLAKTAAYLCLVQFCDWDENESHPAGVEVMEKVGQHLADAVLVYEDGDEKALPIRRRFEVNSPTVIWGHSSFASLPHIGPVPNELTDPLSNGTDWGRQQSSVQGGGNSGLWLCALENPQPERKLKALRLEAKAEDLVAICGLTLFHGRENPLRYERLTLYQITLPKAGAMDRWETDVDLGVVARMYTLADFRPESWLVGPDAGLGERTQPAGPYLYVEVSASPAARLSLRNTATGASYEFDLSKVVPGEELAAWPGGARITVLEREKVWLQGRVIDSATRRPTPVRLAFRSKEGRYIPPYGHRTEINDAWFEDYGADVKLMNSSFAYVDGEFQVELPVGEVYVEITKGFEYGAVRRKLMIEPGQRELQLEIARLADFRARGWVTADTHVHFLSPSTAILEAQAEGLNLINLLAAQWGDLFTNVGDLAHGPLTSRDGETLVWLGTENRQHLLGHLGLLGGHGKSVYPMSADGPPEAYLGDPVWTSMADWADACRQREGLVVAVHFPYPTGEVAADIVLGKIDVVELYPRDGVFDNLRFHEWYRYLNCEVSASLHDPADT
jgi:hypothetical protein